LRDFLFFEYRERLAVPLGESLGDMSLLLFPTVLLGLNVMRLYLSPSWCSLNSSCSSPAITGFSRSLTPLLIDSSTRMILSFYGIIRNL